MLAVTTIPEDALPANPQAVIAIYGTLLLAGVIACLVLGLRFLRQPPAWAARARAIAERPWSLRDGGVIIIALLNLQLALVVLHSVLGEMSLFFWIVLNSLSFHVAGLVMVAAYLRARRRTWREAFGLHGPDFARHFNAGALAYLTMLPVLFFAALAYQLVLTALDYPTDLQEIVFALQEPETMKTQAYIAFLAVAVAPLFEEILFRGIGLPLIAKRFGMGPAVLVTSLGFALIHFNLASFVPLFTIAVALSLAYIHTGSLLAPIVLHGIFNGVNLCLLMLAQ